MWFHTSFGRARWRRGSAVAGIWSGDVALLGRPALRAGGPVGQRVGRLPICSENARPLGGWAGNQPARGLTTRPTATEAFSSLLVSFWKLIRATASQWTSPAGNDQVSQRRRIAGGTLLYKSQLLFSGLGSTIPGFRQIRHGSAGGEMEIGELAERALPDQAEDFGSGGLFPIRFPDEVL